jgi:hypothetical protein
MTGPIYKMFRAGIKEAWYQLSKEEQDAMFARIEDYFICSYLNHVSITS